MAQTTQVRSGPFAAMSTDCPRTLTTFPCHDCAKHIVGAGISQVLYIEPYPKCMLIPLYPDSIDVEGTSGDQRVVFEPFVGVAPRSYIELFTAPIRKSSAGVAIQWEPNNANAKLGTHDPTTPTRESQYLEIFENRLTEAGLKTLD